MNNKKLCYYLDELLNRLYLDKENRDVVILLEKASILSSKGHMKGIWGETKYISEEYALLWRVLDILIRASAEIRNIDSVRMINKTMKKAIKIYDPEIESKPF